MRILLELTFPHEPFNSAVRKGTAGETIGRILEESSPEAVYFTERDGRRGATLIIDVSNPSDIPSFAEPWFLNFEADWRFRTVMTPNDLQAAGLEALGQKWG